MVVLTIWVNYILTIYFYIFRVKKLKRKISLKWYIQKSNNLQNYKTTSNKKPMSILPVSHNNNIYATTTDTDTEKRDEIHCTTTIQELKSELLTKNNLLKKLGKIDVSKPQPLDSAKECPNTQAKRDKTDEYYYKHRQEKLEYQKNYNRQKGDAIKDYNKNYYIKRREEILEKARTKVTCECGCVVQLFNMNSHKKTKKHVRYLEMRQTMMNAVVSAAVTPLVIDTKC